MTGAKRQVTNKTKKRIEKDLAVLLTSHRQTECRVYDELDDAESTSSFADWIAMDEVHVGQYCIYIINLCWQKRRK